MTPWVGVCSWHLAASYRYIYPRWRKRHERGVDADADRHGVCARLHRSSRVVHVHPTHGAGHTREARHSHAAVSPLQVVLIFSDAGGIFRRNSSRNCHPHRTRCWGHLKPEPLHGSRAITSGGVGGNWRLLARYIRGPSNPVSVVRRRWFANINVSVAMRQLMRSFAIMTDFAGAWMCRMTNSKYHKFA